MEKVTSQETNWKHCIQPKPGGNKSASNLLNDTFLIRMGYKRRKNNFTLEIYTECIDTEKTKKATTSKIKCKSAEWSMQSIIMYKQLHK